MFENCFSQPELTLMRSVGKQKKLPSQFNGSNHSKKKKKKIDNKNNSSVKWLPRVFSFSLEKQNIFNKHCFEFLLTQMVKGKCLIILKDYLLAVLCHNIALSMWWIFFFDWRTNVSFSRCLEFWLYVLIISSTRFRVNPHSIVPWILRNSLLEAGAKSKFKWLQLDSKPQPLSS